MRSAILLLAGLIAWTTPALADNKQDWSDCTGGSAERAEAACTRLIKANKKGTNLGPAYNNRALAYSKQGDLPRAMADYEQAVRLDPTNATIHNNFGVAYNAQHDFDRAITEYNKAIALDPKYADAFSNRGDAYRMKGDYDRSISDLGKAIRLKPGLAISYTSRGLTYVKKGDRERASSDFRAALSHLTGHPTDQWARETAEQELAELKQREGWPLKTSPPYDNGAKPCLGDVARLTDSAFEADRVTGYICNKQYDLAVIEITKLIEDRQAFVDRRYYLGLRAELYERMGKTELASKDSLAAKVAGSGFNEIQPVWNPHSSPSNAGTDQVKAAAGAKESDFAQCQKGFTEACTRELNNKQSTWCKAALYMHRAAARLRNGDVEPAEADFDLALKNDCGPGSTDAPEIYKTRAEAYLARGNTAKAIADISKALDLSDKNRPDFLRLRIDCYRRTGDVRLIVADLTEMIRISYPEENARPVYAERGEAYEKIGETELAKRDYEKVLAGSSADALPYEKLARSRLAALSSAGQLAQANLKSPPAAFALPSADQGKRIALVIGNSAYSNVRGLKNADADARAIAGSLRSIGFEVIEKHDLDFAALIAELKSFGDKAPQYDWALVYYAGHGIEVGGVNYLIPVDAELANATHVDDEAVPLNRVLAKVEGAQKLRLVILDACRENPFIAKMASAGGTRSIGRGLARIEPSGGVLVAYSARDGQLAQDGDGANSPFAQALIAHIGEPGLEINMLFRKVRDDVKTNTKGQQEPFTYGSLPAEALYFKAAGQ
ncbi:caspase family protein [Methyloceanibacter sp.]|uniref:caspase family protein n=1 Tax=Methyloceanibacter sp. TaxID=1965321 RepID=UPI003D6D9A42